MVKKGSSKVKKKTEKKDVVEIPVGKYVSKIKKNPWIASTFVLGVLLILALALGTPGASGSLASEDVVTANVMNFLNSQVDGIVTLISITNKGTHYELIVDYQGEQVPLQASLDGKYIFSELIPLAGAPTAPSVNPGTQPQAGQRVTVETGDAPVLGSASAPVTIVEFTDYECPFCGRHYTDTYPSIVRDYVDTGKAKIVMMDFPLSFHPNAQKASESAHCVRDQKGDEGYFMMHDKLFENQQTLSVANFKAWAREIGVNGGDFDECLDSGKFATKVQEGMAYGSSIGVSGTPGFFINGVPVSGAQPYSVFKQIIDQELAA